MLICPIRKGFYTFFRLILNVGIAVLPWCLGSPIGIRASLKTVIRSRVHLRVVNAVINVFLSTRGAVSAKDHPKELAIYALESQARL